MACGPRWRAVRAVVLTGLACAVIAFAPPTSADPLKGIRADIATAQARLHGIDNTAEVFAERYDGAMVRFAAAQRSAAVAQDRLVGVTARLATLRQQAGAFAAATYESGLASSGLALLGRPGGPANYLEALSTLDAVARQQAALVAATAVARHDQASAQSAADDAVAAQRQVLAQLAGDRARVQAQARQAQQVLAVLQTKQAELVRQARAAVAAAAMARQASALATAQRAEAQARTQAGALTQEAERTAQATRQFATAAASPPDDIVRARPPTPTAKGSGGKPGHGRGSNADNAPGPTGAADAGGGAATAVRWARRELGQPYVWGAAGPDTFDCSGLTQYVWGKAGVSLAHFTGDQWNEGRHVAAGQLRPGDLVFFYSDLHHVGIYVGGGEMINAPHSGAVVEQVPLSAMPDYQGAVRPLG